MTYRICKEISLVRLNNKTINYFDAASLSYNKKSTHGMWSFQREREKRAILSIVKSDLIGSFLDLGSGAGYYSKVINQETTTRETTCVDFSMKMLEQIDIASCIKVHEDISTFCDDNKYDLILCAGALEFLDTPTDVFINVSKMLSPNGHFVVLFPLRNIFGKCYKFFHSRHSVDINLFSEKQIRSMLTGLGLEVVKWASVLPFTMIAEIKRVDNGEDAKNEKNY